MKYFTIHELTRSDTAIAKGISNVPTEKEKRALEALVENVLDPLREAYGKPIRISSGYRSPALNRAVGGVSNSQHVAGEAADISVASKTENEKLFNLIQSLGIPFDQLIDEKGFSWVHVSYREGRNRKEVLKL